MFNREKTQSTQKAGNGPVSAFGLPFAQAPATEGGRRFATGKRRFAKGSGGVAAGNWKLETGNLKKHPSSVVRPLSSVFRSPSSLVQHPAPFQAQLHALCAMLFAKEIAPQFLSNGANRARK